MIDPRHIRIDEFDYALPDNRIARYPLACRDSSQLLLFRKGKISHDVFSSLPNYVTTGTLMVFNNTRVIQARLKFRKSTGAIVEVFCLEPAEPSDYDSMFTCTNRCRWICMVGNLKRWKNEPLRSTVFVRNQQITLSAIRMETERNYPLIEFIWDGDGITWSEILDSVGELPIPPYLNRQTEESDKTTYQTIYSKIKGSVAAPTAGLHFTNNVLAALDANQVEREELTLHVGAGTFRPVKSEEIAEHEMHTEHFVVSRHTIERLLAHEGQCLAVGTTSVRTLESLYYLGIILADNPKVDIPLHVSQWAPYETGLREIPVVQALSNILTRMDWLHIDTLCASTAIIIVPSYRFHIVKAMLTNFHQPRSTLLLLVSAFIGDAWREVYRYALQHDFRFLSYGDSSLLIP